MTITLDTPTTGGTPSAKFPEPGNSIIVGIVNINDYQQRNFDTEEPLWWDDACTEPRNGKVVTGLVVSADGVVVDTEDGERPVVPGDLVSFWCEGGKFLAYRDAVKAAKGANVGDVMRWVRGDDEAPKKKGFNARKVYDIAIRRPEAKDGDLADRCVEQYHALKDRPALDAAPAATVDVDEAF
jgi:hypothetical protein